MFLFNLDFLLTFYTFENSTNKIIQKKSKRQNCFQTFFFKKKITDFFLLFEFQRFLIFFSFVLENGCCLFDFWIEYIVSIKSDNKCEQLYTCTHEFLSKLTFFCDSLIFFRFFEQ